MNNKGIPWQLPLQIHLDEEATFENFFSSPENSQTVDGIKDQCNAHGEQFIYLWGNHGAGCSHLLQAACHIVEKQSLSAIYFPLSELAEFAPSLLDNLEQLDLVCLDNIEEIIGNDYWEQALFHCFNRLRDSHVRLLISANCSPNQLLVQLADLKSRLNWGMVCHLQVLGDEEKLEALQLRAKKRGLILTLEVAHFIIQRQARDIGSLFSTLQQLDEASLSAKRRLTIPFVKEVLGY